MTNPTVYCSAVANRNRRVLAPTIEFADYNLDAVCNTGVFQVVGLSDTQGLMAIGAVGGVLLIMILWVVRDRVYTFFRAAPYRDTSMEEDKTPLMRKRSSFGGCPYLTPTTHTRSPTNHISNQNYEAVVDCRVPSTHCTPRAG